MAVSNTQGTKVINLNPIKCIQINLQHSKAATDNLNEVISRLGTDVIFIQEPYLLRNKLNRISRKYRQFTGGVGHKRAAIVITNRGIDAILIKQLSEDDIVVVEITQGNLKFIAARLYLDIKSDLNNDILKIERILQFAKGKGLILALDSNSRSKVWHDVQTNARGKILEEFILSNRLHVINEAGHLPTYQASRGASCIDIGITNNQLLTLLKTWSCGEDESCSDHRIIKFTIQKNRSIINEYNYQGVRYIHKEENYVNFKNNFISEVKFKFNILHNDDIEEVDRKLSSLVAEETDINTAVEKYEEAVIMACDRTFRKSRRSKKVIENISKTWWSQELTIMRKKTNALRRRYQNTKNDDDLRNYRKIQYLEEKKKYELNIKKAKLNSWKQFCNLTTSTNPWNAAYKVASGKLKQNYSLSTLKKKTAPTRKT